MKESYIAISVFLLELQTSAKQRSLLSLDCVIPPLVVGAISLTHPGAHFFRGALSLSLSAHIPTTDNISGVHEGLTAEVISSEEATEEYYGPYEGYEMADALLSLRDSAAAKSDENEEVYDEQRNWRGYQSEGEEQIYQPHHHQEVRNSKCIVTSKRLHFPHLTLFGTNHTWQKI